MRTAVYAGSFDPFTNGHLDVLERSVELFDKVIVAVLQNGEKQCMFSAERRVSMITELITWIGFTNVSVESYNGLLVDLAQERSANWLVRGVRNVADYLYETQMESVNKNLAPRVQTVYLAARPELGHISSSIVKELLRFGGNINRLVPEPILYSLHEHHSNIE